jgi:chaperonin cofactor prefoldin
VTGGSKFKEGAISVSPETVELIIEQFTGGAGKIAKDLFNLPFSIADGDIALRNIPVARRFVGNMQKGIDRGVYMDNREEMKVFVTELKNATREERQELIRDPLYKLVGSFQDTEKRLEDLNKTRKTLAAAGKDTSKIEDRMEELQVAFNSKYNKKTGRD